MGLFDWNFDGKIDALDEIFEYELLFEDDMDLIKDNDLDPDDDFDDDFDDF